MVTLSAIVDQTLTLSLTKLRADKQLVSEIQRRLATLGLYPGGQWIDGLYGPRSSAGLTQFCQLVGLDNATRAIVDSKLAHQLLTVKQLPTVFQAAVPDKIKAQLADLQTATPATDDHLAFLDRTLKHSPLESQIREFPRRLTRTPTATQSQSYGATYAVGGRTITFQPYPDRGKLPQIEPSGLDFLDANVTSACVCVGSFVSGSNNIRTHWLGRNAVKPLQFLSATKFIPILNLICQANAASPATDIDNCLIGLDSDSKRYRFYELASDVVNYEERVASSNALSAMFKRFSDRQGLENWVKAVTGNPSLEFKGYYGEDPFIANPTLVDMTSNVAKTLVQAKPEAGAGNNYVTAYDLVRLISMLGWHHYLVPAQRLPAAQWHSLESLVRALGQDTARYIDIAFETLGLVNVMAEPVVLSKLGLGNSALTYVALAQWLDQRQTPNRFHTVAMALWVPNGSDAERDTTMATAVTTIVRRLLTGELA